MAIAFARARYISRSTGGSAVRSASYNAREAIADERTGEHYSFKHRGAPAHHEVLLPEGADGKLSEAAGLWNAAEAAERRKDAQVARELVIALPADPEVSHEDRVELVRSFALQHFVSRGLAVQLDVHAPHAGDIASERANWHAHLLVTTRRVEGSHLAVRKARELEPALKRVGGRAVVTEGERWGELWRQHQDRYFALHGLELRVEAAGAVPQEHVGPIRMRTPGSEAVLRAEAIERENAAAARDPAQVLAALTRNNATFSERDLDRYLARHLKEQGQHLAVKADVLGHAEVIALHDRETGEAVGRYTVSDARSPPCGSADSDEDEGPRRIERKRPPTARYGGLEGGYAARVWC